jgi:hypothetical protein
MKSEANKAKRNPGHLQRPVSRRAANTIVRSVGLDVKRQKVCADRFSMMHKGSKLIDLHGVDTITAAKIIQAANWNGHHSLPMSESARTSKR